MNLPFANAILFLRELRARNGQVTLFSDPESNAGVLLAWNKRGWLAIKCAVCGASVPLPFKPSDTCESCGKVFGVSGYENGHEVVERFKQNGSPL